MRTTIIVVLSLVPSILTAQRYSPEAYLPLDHWSMPLLEYLVDRGVLADPSPMVRPWVVGAVVTALERAERQDLSPLERQTVERLRAHFARPDDPVHVTAALEATVLASTHARRWSLREMGPDRVTPTVGTDWSLGLGPGVIVVNSVYDPNLNDDPDYGGEDTPALARFTEAYGAFRSRYADLEIGRVSRNWGPTGFPGLLISDVPFSYDQIYARLGTDKANVRILIAQLDDAPNRDGVESHRFWVVHRVAAQLFSFLDLAIWEGSVIAGPNRGLEFWFLNPFQIHTQARDERNVPSNVLVGGEFEARVPNGPTIAGALTVDDLQLFGRSANDEPPSYALTATIEGRVGPAIASLGYTQVSNLMYRTPDPAEGLLIGQSAFRNRPGTGLARNFSDYDQTTLRLTTLALPGVLVGPEFTLLRQGEGDFRLPFPPVSENPTTPTLFDGVVERTWRAALRASLVLPEGVSAMADVGIHHVTNAGHVAGQTRDRFVATVGLRYAIGGAWSVR